MLHRIQATVAARPLLSAALIVLLAAVAPRSARAALITVPDGNFSNTPANGTAGGILALGATTTPIGDGTWSATYVGLKVGALTLASPNLTIAGGGATISGVGSLLGQSNGGYFSQALGTAYKPLTAYTLSATIDAGVPLGSNFFNNTGVGIGLTDASGNLLASSVSQGMVSLVSGTTYQVSLTYTTGATATSTIGLRLFDSPNGMANPIILSGVTFDNVTLTAVSQAIVPEPASLAMLGLGLLAPAAVAARRRRRAA